MNGTGTIAEAGPYPYTSPMTATLIGYARCSTRPAGLGRPAPALSELGVAEDRIYTYHGLTGTTRARPGLDQTLAAVREGDTLVVPKLDRLARSVPDARAIADQLQEQGVRLAQGRALYDPGDPMGKMFFNILATFAEFEADLSRMRTREGMAIARAKGKLRGKQPKLSDRQQRELCRMHATGEYSISDLAELFSVSRPTVYRTLKRRPRTAAADRRQTGERTRQQGGGEDAASLFPYHSGAGRRTVKDSLVPRGEPAKLYENRPKTGFLTCRD